MSYNNKRELTYESFVAFMRAVSIESFEEEELRSMWNSIEAVKVSRTYRDNLFRMIYRDKRELLSLYNAINQTDYNDPEELFITTLENAIYVGIKNDLSFIIASELNLYEHQSTMNPNIPLRQLQYVTTILRGLVSQKALYSTKLTKIPLPRFVVFYNGDQEEPERQILKLSDSYLKQSEEPDLELKVTMLNINYGKNRDLMEKCESLKGYMIFNDKVKSYKKNVPIREAVKRAVDECIEENVLVNFLSKNRAEVMEMNIFMYDQKLHEEVIAEEAQERGWAKGMAEGKIEGMVQGMAEGMAQGMAQGMDKGIMLRLITQTVKKLKRGKSVETIAEELEEEISVIKEICDAVENNASEYDVDKIYESIAKE